MADDTNSWTTVKSKKVVHKPKPPQETNSDLFNKPKTPSMFNPLAAVGVMQSDSQRKFGGGQNKPHGPSNANKIEEQAEEGDFHRDTTTHSFRVGLQKAREAKKLLQKDLDLKCSFPMGTIKTFENGQFVPTSQQLIKINKILESKLRATD